MSDPKPTPEVGDENRRAAELVRKAARKAGDAYRQRQKNHDCGYLD